MTEEQMEKLSSMIVNKLLEKQAEIDDMFNENIRKMIDHENSTNPTMDIDVKYTTVENANDDAFISHNESLLEHYLKIEDYEKANNIKKILDDYKNNQ